MDDGQAKEIIGCECEKCGKIVPNGQDMIYWLEGPVCVEQVGPDENEPSDYEAHVDMNAYPDIGGYICRECWDKKNEPRLYRNALESLKAVHELILQDDSRMYDNEAEHQAREELVKLCKSIAAEFTQRKVTGCDMCGVEIVEESCAVLMTGSTDEDGIFEEHKDFHYCENCTPCH